MKFNSPHTRERAKNMVGLSHYPKNFHTLQTWSSNNPSQFSTSSSSSSSTSASSTLISSMKTTKTLILTLIYTQLLRLHRSLTRAKSVISRFISQTRAAKNKYKHKVRLGSFRLHYNWSSSHVMPTVPARSALISADNGELSGYLKWLEDKNEVDDGEDIFYSARYDDAVSEDIDRLAELFIASCHDKFLLEKQESYRRFQEMLDRSV